MAPTYAMARRRDDIALCLADVRPGDLLRYAPLRHVADRGDVLVYLRPHDGDAARAWEVGVFLGPGGRLRTECLLYLRLA